MENSIIYSVLDNYNVNLSDIKLFSTKSKIKIFLCKIDGRINRNSLKKAKYHSIEKKLVQIGKPYDFIIPVVSDFNNAKAVMKFCKKRNNPFVMYQLDPIGSNITQAKYRQDLEQFEKELYQEAAAILTTPIIAKEKEADTQYNHQKIVPIEFPNVVDLCSHVCENTNKIICAFCGSLILGVRDCKYTLDLFSRIPIPNLLLQFAGTGQENILLDYAKGSMKDRLVHLGKLSKMECSVLTQKANFLINIGNSMTNQVPSKLFDYISTGLPIINICTNANCPTIPYLEKYKLAINIIETYDEKEKIKQVTALNKFLISNCGIKNDYKFIQSVFYKNTPEYVGTQFLNVLQNSNHKDS